LEVSSIWDENYNIENIKEKNSNPWHDRGNGVNQWITFSFPYVIQVSFLCVIYLQFPKKRQKGSRPFRYPLDMIQDNSFTYSHIAVAAKVSLNLRFSFSLSFLDSEQKLMKVGMVQHLKTMNLKFLVMAVKFGKYFNLA
jgi:hypothetical protein